MTAVRSAVAPVAQALATLYTGMPVWPICFCSCWPMPALAFIRFPAASTPLSAMVTPASESAPMAAWAARSTASRSGCLPNLVIRIPRIQTSSLPFIVDAPSSGDQCRVVGDGRESVVHRGGRAMLDTSQRSRDGFEAKPHRLVALGIGADRGGGEPPFHSVMAVLGMGLDVDEVGADSGAVTVDHGRHKWSGDARRRERDDRERPHCALGRDRDGGELGGEAVGAGVTPAEEASTAVSAFLGDQVRFGVVEHQIVDQWYLRGHVNLRC